MQGSLSYADFYVHGDTMLPFALKPHVNAFGRAITAKWGSQHREANAEQGIERAGIPKERFAPETKHD